MRARIKERVRLLAPLAAVATVAVAGCDTTVDPLGVELSGTIKIPAALAPMLPPTGSGVEVAEVEPNTAAPNQHDIGIIETDSAGVTITGNFMVDSGEVDVADVRDRFVFQVNTPGSVSIWMKHQCASGFTWLYYDDEGGNLAWPYTYVGVDGANDGDGAAIISGAVEPGVSYLVSARYMPAEGCSYTIDIKVLSGTIVGPIYIGAYGSATPFRLDDPVANATQGDPKSVLPLGGTTAVALSIDGEGNMVGTFSNLFIAKGTPVYLFAYADNDGTNPNGLNFTVDGPPSTKDFVMSTVLEVSETATDVGDLALTIDSAVLDVDFDGILDDVDNCTVAYNPDQLDGDGDLVGDVCDNCPDVVNEDQANLDGVGKGDACNQDDTAVCPYLFLRSVASCPTDADGDDVEETAAICPETKPLCVAEQLVTIDVDVCPGLSDPDQEDHDGDALDPLTHRLATGAGAGGDECDNDDDNDGVLDDADNCQFKANADQADLDVDGEGDVCDPDDDDDGVDDVDDNCPTTPNADQADADGDGKGDLCDP